MPVGLYAGANVSNGNGVTVAFPYNFKILDQTHVEVKVDGVLKALGADYTVSGVGNSNGGNVTFGVAPANGAVVQRARKVPYKRDQDYQYNGDLREEVVDPDLDTIEMQVQQIAADAARSFKAPLSVTADQVLTDADWAARAGKFLRIKNDGSGPELVSASPDLSSFTATGVGALARSWSSKVGELVSVKDFGAIGDGVANDSAAFTAWAVAITALGRAIGVIPPGTYNVTVPKTAAGLCAFQNLTGFALIAGGAVIADQQAYGAAEVGILFKFTNCKNVSLPPGLKVTSANTVSLAPIRGMHAMQFASGSANLDITFEITGGLTGVQFYRASTDPDADRSRHYRLNIKATNVEYPVNGQFSGDDGIVFLDCTGCGRNFDYYGCSNLTIDVRSKNQQITSIIGAAEGVSFSGAKIRIYDRESDACQAAAPVLTFGIQNVAPVTIRDVEVHFDCKNPAGAPWGYLWTYDKLNDALAGDAVGRGHKIENIKFSGISEQVAGAHAHFAPQSAGTFVAPDVVRNITVKDMILVGASVSDDWSKLLGALVGKMVFQNVYCDSALIAANGANGRVVFKDCVATAFNANQQGAQITYSDTGEAMVLLDTKIANNSATIDFLFGLSLDYDAYAVVISGMRPATNATQLQMLGSSDNGGTWKNGAGAYVYEYGSQAGGGAIAAGGGAATFVGLTPASVSNAVGKLRAQIEIATPGDTIDYKHLNFRTSFYETTIPSLGRTDGAALYAFATALNALRFLMSAGNITSGTFSLYGIRKS